MKYTAKFREHLLPAAGTQYFAMDVDEVPAAGGSRPDRVSDVSWSQEGVQRHFVEQLVEPVRGVPVLDAPVPQMVDKLEDVLRIVDLLVPVQEIEVPMISSLSRPSLRATDSGTVGGRAIACVDAAGSRDRCRRQGVDLRLEAVHGSSLVSGGHQPHPVDRPEGFTASPGRYTNTGQG